MNIKQLAESEPNSILMVTSGQLMEFAREVVAQAKENLSVPEEKVYNASEFAERHKVSKSTLWRWELAGILKKTVIGGKTYYRDSDLIK